MESKTHGLFFPLAQIIISETRLNVEFLVAQRHISSYDGWIILAKIPNLNTPAESVGAFQEQTQELVLSEQRPNLNTSAESIGAFQERTPQLVLSESSPPPVPPLPPRRPTCALPETVQAKALWGYNEERQHSDDLAFRTVDVIEVIEEADPDWWTGRCNGHQAVAYRPPGVGYQRTFERPPIPPLMRAQHQSHTPATVEQQIPHKKSKLKVVADTVLFLLGVLGVTALDDGRFGPRSRPWS